MRGIEPRVAIDEKSRGAHSHFRPLTIRPVLPIMTEKRFRRISMRRVSLLEKKKKGKEGTNVGADVHLATRQACRKAIAVMSSEIELRTFTRFRAHVSPIWKRLAKELQRPRRTQ